ncbi:GIY-YIG nuclease family protein [Acuticoccus kandeliae]|uniref:GIY-YIG nuclease family protein n=1 Tax=Acuticoccus kandeliae TaxID=2073160 RepID=UPI000D3E621E|nr:GIY-YIG nuclease family protein [Acuticoccus kandeliae]
MDRSERKAAIEAYKQRKDPAGVYAIRCAPTGACWVGKTHDLDKIWNRLTFSLGQSVSTHVSLQAAWDAHPVSAFAMERLEKLDEDMTGGERDRALKKRRAYWAERLGAEMI